MDFYVHFQQFICKMKIIALFFFFALATVAVGDWAQEYTDAQFELFKNRFSRVYESAQKESARKKVFVENLKFIDASNKLYTLGHRRFQVEVNNFTDYTDEEFSKFFLSRPIQADEPLPVGIEVHKVSSDPAADGSQWELLTSVKNQGKCSAGWAFAAVASLENALAMQNPWYTVTPLSEQNLIDCSTTQGNDGCTSGSVENAFEYVLANHGIDSEKSYSYEGKSGECRFRIANRTAALSRYVFVEKDNEDALADAVSRIGPVAAMIDAAPKSFRFYQSGIYDDVDCTGKLLTHALTVTGYDFDVWKLRNSFGTEWGENGEMRLTRHLPNICGIHSRASYPVLEPQKTIVM